MMPFHNDDDRLLKKHGTIETKIEELKDALQSDLQVHDDEPIK